MPLPPKKNNFWFTLEEVAKVLCQQPADGLGSLFITWGFHFTMCETGDFGQMISKLKFPLNESKRRKNIWVSPTPTLPNNIQPGTTQRAPIAVSSQEKDQEIKKKSSTHIYICSSICVPNPESLQGHFR